MLSTRFDRVVNHHDLGIDLQGLVDCRRITAMQAGEAAGGDIRGKQSASLIIVGPVESSMRDLRVDDHPEPLSELERREQVSREEWMIYRRFVPSRYNCNRLEAALGLGRVKTP
jgi:uncharacterized Ntn-hydrolase superfamily protein